ncbi:hypothetical protein ACIBKY_44115 [Nonomuraea sp. NPDC050394]|uniref:hypothetical protein n=1 Tax=Nonomuraea sp. NPDC050394 TaxID=3364363 RepID=UPI0037B424D3
MVRRLKHEVTGLMRQADMLKAAATGPPDTLVVSLQNARTAVESVRTELGAWGLMEVREGDRGAGVEALLEFDIAEELARRGITLDWSVEELFARLRRQLLQTGRVAQGQGRTSSSDGPGGGVKDLLDAALSSLDELLANQNVRNDSWRRRARKLLGTVSELLITLLVGIVAVGFTVLAVDEPLAKEMTKKVIDLLATAMSLQLIYAVREKLKPPQIAAVLHVAGEGMRSQAGQLRLIMNRVGLRRALSTYEMRQIGHLAVCVSGHVFTVERLVELSDCAEWPQAGEYVRVCRRLRELCDGAAESDSSSVLTRWRLRRGLVTSLNEVLVELDGFSVPDHLPMKLPG